MSTLFGQQGQPVGTIDEFAYYDKAGKQLGEIHDGHLFSSVLGDEVSKDQWMGSFVNGVMYNDLGYPQAFTEDARSGVALVPPKLRSALTDRVLAAGLDVSAERSVSIPSFLREKLDGPHPRRDGIFS